MKSKLFAAAVLAGLISASAIAQTQTPQINQTQAQQAARIKQGVASGQLTAREEARVRAQQRNVKAIKKTAKADGSVTNAERAQIKKAQRKSSATIYRQKHDGQKR